MNPKKTNFADPTPGLERAYFKFVWAQDVCLFVETKDKLENYAVLYYKHSILEAVTYMENMKTPSYTKPEEPTYPIERVSY